MLKKSLFKAMTAVLIMAVLMCSLPVGYVSASEYIATGTTSDGFEYGIDQGYQVTITGYSGAVYRDLVIPTEINGYPVTVIDTYAFSGTYLEGDLIIPEGIWIIGDYAFEGCNQIKNLYIPKSVYALRTHSFDKCTGLQSIIVDSENEYYDSRDNCNAIICSYENKLILGCNNTIIPDTVTQIGEAAFSNCREFESIVIPDSVTAIEPYAFSDCYSLKSIEIPEGVTYINPYTFNSCTSLESIILPVNINFAWYAFEHCYALKDVYYRGTETEWRNIMIPEYNDCLLNATVHYNYGNNNIDDQGLIYELDEEAAQAIIIEYTGVNNSVIIPKSIDGYPVVYIAANAFDNCLTLESVIIEEGLFGISENAFFNCENLRTVALPESITFIDNNAFHNCLSLQEITLPDSIEHLGQDVFLNCQSLVSATLPNNLTEIPANLFCACSSLESVTLPEGVTNIGSSAFYGCSALKSIVFPETVTTIGSSAFYNCSGLESISFPDSVTSIDGYAFYGNTKLGSVMIPENVTNIGLYAFSGCPNITSITVDESNKVFDSRNDCDAIINTASDKLIAGCVNTVIPEDITSLEKGAFDGCSKLETITIPQSVTEIGGAAFRGCTSLRTIVIPDNVTALSAITFESCTNLENITLSKNLTEIGISCFNKCSGLNSITIPENVTSIGSYAFSNCTNLENINIPKAVTSIGSYAFKGCASIKSIEIPEKVTVIEREVFANCKSLIEIIIPDGVTTINYRAFANCLALENIKIPVSIIKIVNYSFASCESLTDVYFNGTEEQWNAISVGTNNDSLLNATIHFISEETETTATSDEVEPTESVATDAEETTAVTTPAESTTKEYYTVVFVDYDGKFISAQTVKPEESATAPQSPVRTGYTFTGWDTDFDVVTADLTVKALYSRNSIPVSTATTGTLKVEVIGGTGFNISVNDGTARPQGASYANSKLNIGSKVTLTAFTSNEAEFIGWMNPSTGTVLSASETYTFVSTGDDYIKAMYQSVIEGVNVVAFKNSKAAGGNGQILDMQYYAAGDDIAEPDAPAQVGYTFAGWSMTTEEIQNELAASNDVLVVADWDVMQTYVKVSVTNGTIQGAGSADVLAYTYTTIVADAAPSGQKFGYWTDSSGKVVSYDADYRFVPTADTVLTANYVAESVTVQYQPVVGIAADPATEGEKITYILSWDVKEEVGTVINAGLMLVNKDDYNADTFYHGTTDIKVFDHALGSDQIKAKNTYSIIKSESYYDNTYIASTWLIYTDATTGESVTVYSDPVEVTKFG